MHCYHEQGLREERGREVRSEPVDEFEDAGGEHYEGDVEGETGGGAGAVDGVDLVGVGG